MIKGFTRGKPPLREHRKDGDCDTEVSKDLSRQRGETEPSHNASFMQASLLCLTMLHVHLGPASHSSHHPKVCVEESQNDHEVLFLAIL